MTNSKLNNIVHFISLNVQGLRSKDKLARLGQYIIQQKANFVFIQETQFTIELEYLIKQ